MRIFAAVATAALAAFAALPASAQGPKLYPYATSVNYCPAGLQPIVLNGVICCGQPTVGMTWQQVVRHPVQRVRHTRDDTCPEGQKGCN